MKKFIAVLLTFAIIFTLGIPAFAAEEGAAEDAVITQELHEDVETPAITEEEIKDILDSEEVREELEENGVDVDEILDSEYTQYEYIKDFSAWDLIAHQAGSFFFFVGDYIISMIVSPIGAFAVSLAFVVTAPLAPLAVIASPFISAISGIEEFIYLLQIFGEEWDAFREYNI